MSMQIVARVDDHYIVEVSPQRWMIHILTDLFSKGSVEELFDLAYPWVQVALRPERIRGPHHRFLSHNPWVAATTPGDWYFVSTAWSFSHQSILTTHRAGTPPFFATQPGGEFCIAYIDYSVDAYADKHTALTVATHKAIASGGKWSYSGGLGHNDSWQHLAQLALGVPWDSLKHKNKIPAARQVLSWWEAQDTFPADIPLQRELSDLAIARRRPFSLAPGPVLVG